MKKNLIKTFIILIFMLNLFVTTYVQAMPTTPKSDSSSLQTDITSDTFLSDFNPETGLSTEANNFAQPIKGTIKSVVKSIVGLIQLIGGILTVISVTMFGFNMVLTTHTPLANDLGLGKKFPGGRKDLLDFGRNLVIGSVLLFSSATLVKLMLKIFLS